MNNIDPGTEVLIIEDCRAIDSLATGQVGVYEGDFPRRVLAMISGEVHEYDYQSWMEWWESQPEPRIPTLEEGSPQLEGDCWLHTTNPRIRLSDGSEIWGDECWWQVAEDVSSLEEAQEELKLKKVALRTMFEVLSDTRHLEEEKP